MAIADGLCEDPDVALPFHSRAGALLPWLRDEVASLLQLGFGSSFQVCFTQCQKTRVMLLCVCV